MQSFIRYGDGIDSTQEVLQLSLDLGFIDRSGAWFSCPFLETNKELAKEVDPDVDVEDAEKLTKAFKFQGQDKVYSFLNRNPKLVKSLESMIKEVLA